ncbi:MAG: MotA/TolQ/ExbB proton channel family protein [Pseudomonadota bacterium]
MGGRYRLLVYLIAFAGASLIALGALGLADLRTLLLVAGLTALFTGMVLRFEATGQYWYRGLLSLVIVITVIIFAILPFTGGEDGLAELTDIASILPDVPDWQLVLVALFGGFALMSIDELERDTNGRRSFAPDIAFGLLLSFAFYWLVLYALGDTDPASATGIAGAILGDTAIHYIIVILFFAVLSYVVRSFFESFLVGGAAVQAGKGRLYTGSLRRFVRILIGFLPLLGFLGTVLGIMNALGGLPALFANDDSGISDLSGALTQSLSSISLAFETTMLGLVASMIASLLLSYVEKRERDQDIAEEV